jgi:hypothetical protein
VVSLQNHTWSTVIVKSGSSWCVYIIQAWLYGVLQAVSGTSYFQAFVHVSTAYCHCDEPVLEEVTYPSPTDPHNILQLVEWMDDKVLDSITPKWVQESDWVRSEVLRATSMKMAVFWVIITLTMEAEGSSETSVRIWCNISEDSHLQEPDSSARSARLSVLLISFCALFSWYEVGLCHGISWFSMFVISGYLYLHHTVKIKLFWY